MLLPEPSDIEKELVETPTFQTRASSEATPSRGDIDPVIVSTLDQLISGQQCVRINQIRIGTFCYRAEAESERSYVGRDVTCAL